jgi:hypothetical protein
MGQLQHYAHLRHEHKANFADALKQQPQQRSFCSPGEFPNDQVPALPLQQDDFGVSCWMHRVPYRMY